MFQEVIFKVTGCHVVSGNKMALTAEIISSGAADSKESFQFISDENGNLVLLHRDVPVPAEVFPKKPAKTGDNKPVREFALFFAASAAFGAG